MIRSVIRRGDPLLWQMSKEVNKRFVDLHELTCDLWDTLGAVWKIHHFTRGSGIAAPQIGELWRASVVEYQGARYTLINPILKAHSDDMIASTEGCLSFFDVRGVVPRYRWVVVEARNIYNRSFEVYAEGDFASLLQHELDHLNGKLYDSRLIEDTALIPCAKACDALFK